MPKIILEEYTEKDDEKKITRKMYKSKASNDNYTKLNNDMLLDLLKLNLSKVDYDILLYLFNIMNFDNNFNLTQQHLHELCKIINVSKITIRRHLLKLKELNILKSLKYKGDYKVNPLYIYKNTALRQLDLIDIYNKI